MKLIAGLGNPGRKYEGTRHNVGWELLAELGRRHGTSRPRAKFHGETVDAQLGTARVLLLAPQTYMNRSGQSVLAARDFFQIPDEDILIVCDDFQLPLAGLRIRASGTAGGQKGLDDVIRRLGTEQVARLRIGVGSPPEGWDPAAFVLSRFGRQEREEMDQTIGRAADAAELWATEGVQASMNRFNGPRRAPDEE